MQPPRIPRTQLSVPTTWRTIVLWAMLGAPTVCGADPQLSYPAREFRAAWVATVANIDWPSQPGLPAQQQRDELLRIFDRAAELNLNALILQVRPACDALYVSDREPWSPYLSGHMGQAPRPFYDPLAFAVEQAHRRGLELHAWFNPYRALHKTFKGQVSPNHISKTMPAAVKSYDGYLWLDPGNPQTVRHSLDVITDVVRRYDIDGVHLDDYFYPYPTKEGDGRQIPFPDDESFAKWAEPNSPESPGSDAADAATERNEWRRQNVDGLIERLYVEVKVIKPHVKVGISPFGIWRPGHPESIKGFQIAVLTSWAAEAVAALMLLVGVGLWVFYQSNPDLLVGDAAAAMKEKRDNIFPVFILTQVPVGLRGLIVAGIFAAAISSLTSILAALSQTSLSAVYLPLSGLSDKSIPPERNQEILRVSRLLIVIWGIALCATAVGINAYVNFQEANGRPIYFLDLALGLANYVLGTLFAAFLLAWLPLGKNAYGLIWSAPLSIACVFASRFHDDLTLRGCWGVTAVLLITWIASALHPSRAARRGPLLAKTLWLVAGCALMFLFTKYLWFARLDETTGTVNLDDKIPIAWPWYAPLGGSVAFLFGYLLGEPQEEQASGQGRDG